MTAEARAQRRAEDALFFIGKPARVEAGRSVDTAIVVGDDLTVAGNVSGMASAIGGDLHVLSGARIDGPVFVVGGALQIDPGAVVEGPRMIAEGGDFQKVAGSLSELEERDRAPRHLGAIIRAAQMLALFVFSLFLVGLAPNQVQNVRSVLLERPVAAGWVGFGTLLGSLPLCAVLAISLVGIPLVPAVIVAFLIVCVLGLTAVTAAIGYWLPRTRGARTLLGAVTLGSVLLALGVVLPALGGFVLLVASSFGAGAVLLSHFGTRGPRPKAPPSERAEPAPALHPSHERAAL